MGSIRKVGIIGQGHVGAHVANSMILQGVADELYLVDLDEKKLASEVQDLKDSLAFCPHNVRIEGCGTDYEALADCDVIVNAAGKVALAAVDRDGELFWTTDTARTFAGRVAKAGFDGVWVTIANPCDVVATEIWHITGCDPRKVVGSGTALDSSRLRHVLADECGYDQRSICAYMLGEHGASQFAAWSAVNFGGKPLSELETEQPDRFAFDKPKLEDAARQGGYVTYAGKGCTEYAVADAATRLAIAVLSNEHYITACSTLLTGEYGESGHFISLPCVVGADGVEEVIKLDLDDTELEEFHASCAHVKENISRLSWWNE
ncbi:MAG: L-lactate dehydrogenase [Atopobiaceae bacterium]|jgi:L-lactate dehydrogenase|nr:L-lactate dehydrogenase [Atopobiaceae bacterium]MCI2173624.1 L-lactate dehydrogenase [Atopobiaceae bacterium]MCI2207734.1 L-lactate dehydrogenase [Atopobiaceae bacterium]